MGEPRGHPIEVVREGRGRRWPWLLLAGILVLLAWTASVGLPGSGQVRMTVRMSGGPVDVRGNSVRQTVGHVEIHQAGRPVRTVTVPAGRSTTVGLRPGLYQVEVTNFPGCGASAFVLWDSTEAVDIVCSVK